MGRALVRKYCRGLDHLQVFVLLAEVFVLDHEFANGGLFSEVELVNARVEKLVIDIVQADDYLGAYRLDSLFFIYFWHIQSFSDVAQALHVEVGLVAEHDGELLEQHV